MKEQHIDVHVYQHVYNFFLDNPHTSVRRANIPDG